MQHKGTVLRLVLFSVSLLLTACSSAVAELDYEARASGAEQRLEALMQSLPIPPGTVLVKRVNASTGGNLPECAGRQIQALLGTNDLSFEDVVSFYSRTLESSKWHLRSMDTSGVSFDMGDESVLGVSDMYDVSFIGREAVQEGKAKFRTIYLLELLTYVILPVPSHCKGG